VDTGDLPPGEHDVEGEMMIAPAPVKLPGPEWTTPVVEVSYEGSGRQRRLTIAFRIILALPHLVYVALVTIAALVAVVAGWVAALALGRLPGGLADFLARVVQYVARVNAYGYLLLTDRYPAFDLGRDDYAVSVDIPRGVRLNRAAVLFRIVLLIPAMIVVQLIGNGLFVVEFVAWLLALMMGRLPVPLFEAFAAALRYQTRFYAYAALLTSEYPRGLFGDRRSAPVPPYAAPDAVPFGPPSTSELPPPAAPPVTAPPRPRIRTLLLSRSAKVILGVVLALGAFWIAVNVAAVVSSEPETAEWVTVTDIDGVRFDMPRQPHHSTEPVPGTDLAVDLYYVDFGHIGLVAFGDASELPPGDTRTDAQILRDSANGMVTNIVGTIVDSRPIEVDGEPGLDLEATTPREGGLVVLARVALAGDLLVGVQTIFDEDDRDIATAAHNRMAGSIRFDGDDADVADDPSVLNGVYRLEWTLDELVAAGVPEETVYQFGMAGVYTWSLDNGQLQFVGEFPDGSRLECDGTYEITAHEVNLQRQPPCPLWLFTATWELTDAGLAFTNALLDGESFPELDVWMSQKPWTKLN
jgi:hypothetical protein